jgi:hypothetical protein
LPYESKSANSTTPMLLELIARYYKYLWIILVAVVFLKILLSFSFYKDLEGFQGMLFAIFKWYGEEEQELEDLGPRRTLMRLQNVVTLGIYFVLILILVFFLIPKFLGR